MRRALLATTAVLALLIALGGIAWASIPGADGVIHGCYKDTGDNRVIVVDSESSCPGGYTALNWNQTGPTGPTGPTGAQGAAGTNGVSGLETKVASGAANASSYKSLAVSCSSGKKALGGGVDTGVAAAGLIDILTTAPSGATGDGSDNGAGWLGAFFNNDSQARTVYVWVVCATIGS